MGHPSVYPTGTTIFKKEKTFSGYTIMPTYKGALLIDMNGNEVQLWAGLEGMPNKMLPGGYVLGSTGVRNPMFSYQDQIDLVQVDWEGNIVWKYDHTEWIADDGEIPRYMARNHHDYQREGSCAGYYSPAEDVKVMEGNTILLVHENVTNTKISEIPLLDDKIIEVDWQGNLLWSWRASDHVEELGFDQAARDVMFYNPFFRIFNPTTGEGAGDWLHINSVSVVGPNKWYDQGDMRFHPDNIMWSSRHSNILAIISKETGKIVWQLGPNYNETEALKKLGWIIGPHHLHMIPKGLPGAGDMMVFDNGGAGGYGTPHTNAPTGLHNVKRDYSRVLQINPVTLEITWQYTFEEAGFFHGDASKFYSTYISSAQRLPNGNTLITEGADGRLIEVTPEHEIVWEYINPYFLRKLYDKYDLNLIYRAYRIPYDWVPQLEVPEEIGIEPVDVTTFRVPNASKGEGTGKVTIIEGVDPQKVIFTGGGQAFHKSKK